MARFRCGVALNLELSRFRKLAQKELGSQRCHKQKYPEQGCFIGCNRVLQIEHILLVYLNRDYAINTFNNASLQ